MEQQWAYRTIKYQMGMLSDATINEEELEDLLNQQGYEGWELVSCFDTNTTQGKSKEVVMIFKKMV
ncbi:DUF4177 domain-containing protein [Paenibacillus tarimensis]